MKTQLPTFNSQHSDVVSQLSTSNEVRENFPHTSSHQAHSLDLTKIVAEGVRHLKVERCVPPRASRKAGLTLVEVMLALVILGTGMVALVTAAGRCIAVARQAKNYESARELLARVEVEQPMMLEEEVEDVAGNGSFDSPHSNFSWKRTVEQEGFEDDGLWRVVTTISWTEDKSSRNEEVTTLIYWPEDEEGGSFERAP